MRSGLSAVALALRLALASALILLCIPAPLLQAAAPPPSPLQQTGASDTLFLILYPELRQAPAPPFLRPGMRLSYNFAYATFGRTPDDVTPSGSGLLQYDVVAQDRRGVLVIPTTYGSGGQPPATLGYQIALPGLGETWLAPQVLAHAETAGDDQFLVHRLRVEVEGRSYAVVRMQSNTDGGEEVWEFDEQTGMLVFHRQTLFDANGEQTSSNQLTLLSSRQIKLPWRFGSAPPWAQRGAEINLAGSQVMDLGSPPYLALPMTVNLRISKAGPLWSEYVQTMSLNNQSLGQNNGATGVAQIFGGLWLPPEALRVLQAGDVLDRDPISGVTVSVEEASAQRIAIARQGPASLTRYTYDARTGRLIGYYQQIHMGVGIQYTELAEP